MSKRPVALGFPQVAEAAMQGLRGVRLVQVIFEQHFGWIVRAVPQEFDFGIDAHTEVVVDERATGRLLAIQIKCGKSYLRRKSEDGFIYTGASKHLNYYLNQPVPVILVVCDPESGNCWWEHFAGERTSRRSQGWTLTIPYANRLDKHAVARLAELAGSVIDYRPYLEQVWTLNEILAKPGGSYVILSVPRELVEAKETEWFLQRVIQLTSVSRIARKMQGKVDLVVEGYESDPRALWDIEEVRRWFAAVDRSRVPWFWLLSTRPAAGGLRTVASCLCRLERSSGLVTANNDDAIQFVFQNFTRLNGMAKRLGLGDEENSRISKEVIDYLSPKGARS